MNNKSHSIKLFFLLTSFTLSTSSFSSTLNCASVLPPGEYIGNFTDVIDKEDWNVTNYIFLTSEGETGCVQTDAYDNPVRSKIIMNAFLLNHEAKISVDEMHNITGVGYGI